MSLGNTFGRTVRRHKIGTGFMRIRPSNEDYSLISEKALEGAGFHRYYAVHEQVAPGFCHIQGHEIVFGQKLLILKEKQIALLVVNPVPPINMPQANATTRSGTKCAHWHLVLRNRREKRP